MKTRSNSRSRRKRNAPEQNVAIVSRAKSSLAEEGERCFRLAKSNDHLRPRAAMIGSTSSNAGASSTTRSLFTVTHDEYRDDGINKTSCGCPCAYSHRASLQERMQGREVSIYLERGAIKSNCILPALDAATNVNVRNLNATIVSAIEYSDA